MSVHYLSRFIVFIIFACIKKFYFLCRQGLSEGSEIRAELGGGLCVLVVGPDFHVLGSLAGHVTALPQYPHLQNGRIIPTYLTGVL